jgi:hypothetical protein
MPVDFSEFEVSPEEDALFDVAPFNVDAGRKKFIKRIERAIKHVAGEKAGPGAKDFERGYHDLIRYMPTLDDQRIYVKTQGEDYFGVKAGKFPAFAAKLISAVEAGEFDDQIEEALSGPSIPQMPSVLRFREGTKKAKGSGKAPPADLAAMKKSVGRYIDVNGLSVEDTRATLLARGADVKLVDTAIAARAAL